MTKLKLSNLILFLSIFLIALLLINLILTASINIKLKESIKEAQEKTRPARIELTIIGKETCKECNISRVVEEIRNIGLNITSEKSLNFNDKKSMELIKNFNITKLPAIIISGEIEKSNLNFEKRNNALVYEPIAPFFNIQDGKINGLVELTIIKDSSCSSCFDIERLAEQIKNLIVIKNEKRLDLSENEAKEIIERYDIKNIPSLVLSKDAILYPVISQSWAQIGTIESDGSLVLREIQPPYLDLKENKIRGLVNLIMLNDTRCNECYDVTLHKQILKNLGLTIVNETVYDINSNEGKLIIEKYNITKVPTIVLTGDVSVYTSFNQIWKQVGSIESDFSYVFRNMEAIKGAVYMDLENNTIIGK